MDRISIAKTLLKYIGRDSIENDWAIAQGVIVILDGAEPQENRQATKPTPSMGDKTAPKKPKIAQNQSEKKVKSFDTGKLGALRKAGWPVAKIADEMGVSDQTIRNYMKKEGIA